MTIKLTPTTEKFIVHWGEMGGTWGVNRSVAQIHALLYLSEDPPARGANFCAAGRGAL